MLSMHMRMGKNRLEPNRGNLHCIREVSIAWITRTVSISLPAHNSCSSRDVWWCKPAQVKYRNKSISSHLLFPEMPNIITYTKFLILLSTYSLDYIELSTKSGSLSRGEKMFIGWNQSLIKNRPAYISTCWMYIIKYYKSSWTLNLK